jgi:hypothetical protein
LPKLAPLARSGENLIALGEAWDAVQKIIDGSEVEINVELSIGFRSGNQDFKEGLFMCFRINNDEIRLDELHTAYSSNVGSDHFANVYAVLEPRGEFNSTGAEEWLAKLEEVRGFDNTQLETSRDHI